VVVVVVVVPWFLTNVALRFLDGPSDQLLA
jgi:hypothetical protein